MLTIENVEAQFNEQKFLQENKSDTIVFLCNEFGLATNSYNSFIVFTPFKVDTVEYFKFELLDHTLPYSGQFDLIRRNHDTVYLRIGELFSKIHYDEYEESIFYSFADSVGQRRTIQTAVLNNSYVTVNNIFVNDVLGDTLRELKLKSSIDFTGMYFVYRMVVSQKYGIVYYGLYNGMQCTCRRIFNDPKFDPYFLESILSVVDE